VDSAIPCNNISKKSLTLIYWLLTKEVLALRGQKERFTDVPVLIIWRDVEKEKMKKKLKPLLLMLGMTKIRRRSSYS